MIEHAQRDDGALVGAVRAGDDRAFEVLFERYHRAVAAYARGMLRDHARAEDVTQDVFVAALRRLRATERPVAFKPWIHKIAKNACIDAWRRSSRAEVVSYDEPLGEADRGRLVSAAPPPEALLDTRLELEQLKGAFEGLSDAHHEILVLRAVHGYSYQEIGERLGLSRAGVESTLFRARRRLGEEFEELGTGAACRRSRAIIAAAEGGGRVGARAELRLARHVAHCHACRQAAALAGFDLAALSARKGLRAKIGALLPLPPWLRRAWTGADTVRGPVGRVVERAPLALAGAEPLGNGAGKLVAGVAAAAVVAGVGAGTATRVDGLSGPAASASAAVPTGAQAQRSHAVAPRTARRARGRSRPASAAGRLVWPSGRSATTASVLRATASGGGAQSSAPGGARASSGSPTAAGNAVRAVGGVAGSVEGAVSRSVATTASASTPGVRAGPLTLASVTVPAVTLPGPRPVVSAATATATGVAQTVTGAGRAVVGTATGAVSSVGTAAPRAVAPVTAATSRVVAPAAATAATVVAPVTAAASRAVAPVTVATSRVVAPTAARVVATVTAATSRAAAPVTATASSVVRPVSATASTVAPVTTTASTVAPVTTTASTVAPVTTTASTAVAPVTAAVSRAVTPVTAATAPATPPATGASSPSATLGRVTGTVGKVLGG